MAARFLFLQTCRQGTAGVEPESGCTLKTAHRRVINRPRLITTSDFYDERIETKSILPKASRKTKEAMMVLARRHARARTSYAREWKGRDYEGHVSCICLRRRVWVYGRHSSRKGQAKKGAGRMPWHWEPMKDVISCEKLRGGAHIH